jgi:hypothetical protein
VLTRVLKLYNLAVKTLNNGARYSMIALGGVQVGRPLETTALNEPAVASLAATASWGAFSDVSIYAWTPLSSTSAVWTVPADIRQIPNRSLHADLYPNLPTPAQSRMAWTHSKIHIPIKANMTLAQAARAVHNSTTSFIHVSTAYANDTAISTLHYRLAHPDDLGTENDGSYHQLRATQLVKLSGRNYEASAGGMVMDYVWQAASSSYIGMETVAASDPQYPQHAGLVLGTYMWQRSKLATCATQVIKSYVDTEPGFTIHGIVGVMAYGWNNAPFSFNGRSSGWIAGCCETCTA